MISNKLIWGCIGILCIGVGVRLSQPPQVSTATEIMTQNHTQPPAPQLHKNRIKVQVSGAVVYPGIFNMEKGQRVQDAIELAGGLTPHANDDIINYVGKLRDGQHIRVPTYKSKKTSKKSLSKPDSSSTSFDINQATSAEIATHFSISRKAANKIIEYRNQMGWIRSETEITHLLPPHAK